MIPFRYISVRFNTSRLEYTYKCPDIYQVQEGDHVVVETPTMGFTVARVAGFVEQQDLDPHIKYKWIVDKVQLDNYRKLTKMRGKNETGIKRRDAA